MADCQAMVTLAVAVELNDWMVTMVTLAVAVQLNDCHITADCQAMVTVQQNMLCCRVTDQSEVRM